MQKPFRCSASLTIYFTLLIASAGMFILALVEVIRYKGLDGNAGEYTNLVLESLFAGYQPQMLEMYDMFLLDGGFGEETLQIEDAEDEMQALLYDNVTETSPRNGTDFFQMLADEVNVKDYVLITDGDGAVFARYAAEVYKARLGKIAIESIIGNMEEGKQYIGREQNLESQIDSGESALKQIWEEAEQAKTENENLQLLQKGASRQNPFDANRQIRSHGILETVLPAGGEISAKTENISQSLLKRRCQSGTMGFSGKKGVSDRILLQQYAKEYMGNFCEPNRNAPLSYGEEYLIAGKASDEENLKSVVTDLLWMREAANFIYLQTSEAKKTEALALATTLAGASGNPALINLVRDGILAAWAYAESICDVRILLSGGKVRFAKDDISWQVSLANLGEVVTGTYQGAETGQSYEDYLQVLMYTKSLKKIAYRSMDLMEFSLKESGYECARMDAMIVEMKIEAEYQSMPLFFSIFGRNKAEGYHFQKTTNYAYKLR